MDPAPQEPEALAIQESPEATRHKRPAKKAAKKKKAPPPAKKGPGRPSDWRPEYVEQSAKLAAMGLTHIAIADFPFRQLRQ